VNPYWAIAVAHTPHSVRWRAAKVRAQAATHPLDLDHPRPLSVQRRSTVDKKLAARSIVHCRREHPSVIAYPQQLSHN